jgi:DNA-binding NtrC family response regulator
MGSTWRILIVCSVDACRQRLADIVDSWRMETIAVASAAEAQRVLQEQAVSVVFCEDQLADGSFRDVVQAIRAAHARTPLIAMLHDDQSYADALAGGAFDAIPLQYRPTDIRWLLFRAIQNSENARRAGVNPGVQRRTA